jgi:L-arabinose isomerase
MQDHRLDITTLKGGAAVEMINKELQKMVDDVADVNKEAKSPRKLTFNVTFAPTDDGSFGACKLEVSSTLGKQKPQVTSLSFGFDGKHGVASERLNVSQPNFSTVEMEN